MKAKLLNSIMNDKSRHFAELPESEDWESLRGHLEKMPDAVVTDYISDGVTEMWLDFTYKKNRFSVNNQFGEYWFFSQNPVCPEKTLIEIVEYCEELLMNSNTTISSGLSKV
jgi:hypothetical protein